MPSKVINIEGVYHYIDDAHTQIRNIIVESNQLQDHPDSTKYENAEILLKHMHKHNMLSDKYMAIVEFNEAKKKISSFLEES